MEKISSPKQQFLNQKVDDEVYKTINPTFESSSADTLGSDPDKLNTKVADIIGREWDIPRWEDDSTDSMEAMKVRYNAGVDMLYYFAKQSQDESRSIAERQVWADEFTRQSIELYGAPDPDVAKIIDRGGSEQIIERYKPTMNAVRDWLLNKYADVFDAMGLDNKTGKLSPYDIYEAFNQGLSALKAEDPRWDGWKNEIKPNSSGISCESAIKTILIGDKRTPAKPMKAKGIFAHEFIRHALTAINGEDIGLETALPRYLAAEEGFAKLFEVSIDEENLKELKISMNNYSDLAFALGQLDGQKHTRREVINRKIERKITEGKEIDNETITKITRSANQLFRGTPGNDEVSGIFTKNVSYFGGFVPAAEFIKQGLESGKSMDEIMKFANAAKFDPNDAMQRKYIESKIIDRYLPHLPPALPPAE